METLGCTSCKFDDIMAKGKAAGKELEPVRNIEAVYHFGQRLAYVIHNCSHTEVYVTELDRNVETVFL